VLDPILAKRVAARRLIVHGGSGDPVRQVWCVRRIRAEDIRLEDPGLAEVLGPEAVAQAHAELAEERERAMLLASTTDPAVLAQLDDARRVRQQERGAAMLAQLAQSEDAAQALIRRCEAYLRAAVERVGIARDDAPDGVQPPGTDPSVVAVDLTPDGPARTYLRDVRLVPGPDAGPGELPLSELDLTERATLGLLVISALAVAPEIRPFRSGAVSAPAR